MPGVDLRLRLNGLYFRLDGKEHLVGVKAGGALLELFLFIVVFRFTQGGSARECFFRACLVALAFE